MPENSLSSENFDPGLPGLEKTLLASLSLLLVFLPWALGTMHLWSQFTALGIAAFCLVISILPRGGDPVTPGIVKLIRFPVFYAGLLLFLYIAIQGLNPAWKYYELAGRWYMIPIREYIGWLPSGTQTAFADANPFRYLLILAIPFLTICALWCGITRKQSVFFLLIIIVLNGIALSLLGLAQIFTGADKIFWIVEHSARNTVGSFIYRNHAAAYYNLIIGLSGGLALYYFNEGRVMLKRSDPSGIFLFFAVLVFIVVALSLSRTGVVLGTMTLIGLFCVFLFFTLFQKSTSTNKAIAVSIMALVVVFGGFAASRIDYDALIDRFDRMSQVDSIEWEIRWSTTVSTAQMFADNWFYGAGAGSFRWLFPAYMDWDSGHAVFQGERLWEFAHNDLIQFPAELGVVGMSLILLSLIYFGAQMLSRRTYQNPLILLLLFTLGITVAHASVDFVFQNPAILTTWCALLVLGTILVRMERVSERRRRRR